MPRTINRPGLGRGGIAAMEFAVVAPVLMLLIMLTFDVANRMENSIRLEGAALAGAEHAQANSSDMVAVQNRVIAALSGLAGVTVPLPAVACECAVTATACTASCPDGLVRTVTVTAQRSLSPMLLPQMALATGSAVARLR